MVAVAETRWPAGVGTDPAPGANRAHIGNL